MSPSPLTEPPKSRLPTEPPSPPSTPPPPTAPRETCWSWATLWSPSWWLSVRRHQTTLSIHANYLLSMKPNWAIGNRFFLSSPECLASQVINKKNYLAALLLLFPNYINLTTVRRSFKEEGPVALFDKVKDIAQAVLEDDSVLTKYD